MSDHAGDEEKRRLAGLLDARKAATPVPFWWRDDDATAPTPELDRLLELRLRHAVPLGLAVIPGKATQALADRLSRETDVAVLQHGWLHLRHNAPDDKKAEFGDHRPVGEMLEELSAGRREMARLFPEKFLPVLVPPWNRIGETARQARFKAGLPWLSTFGAAPPGERQGVSTHLDVIAWTAGRSAISRAEAFGKLCREVEARAQDKPAPIGVLTHHLDHDEAVWKLLDELLSMLCGHAATSWPPVDALFMPACQQDP